MCPVSCVMCHVSGVMCQVSGVTCHVSHVMCHMSGSPVTFHMSLTPTATVRDPLPAKLSQYAQQDVDLLQPNSSPFYRLPSTEFPITHIHICELCPVTNNNIVIGNREPSSGSITIILSRMLLLIMT